MNKKKLIITTSLIAAISISSIAFATASPKIHKLTDDPRGVAEENYKKVYNETPFIIDVRTGEHLEKPNTDFPND